MHTSTQWATHLQFTPIVATNSLLLALLAQFEVSTTLAILAGAMDGQGILAKYRDFCVPHKVLTRVEAEEASKLVEVAKAFLWGKAKALVSEANGAPVLYCYGADATPVLTKCTLTAKLPSGKRIVRKAGRGAELLVERAFLKTSGGAGPAKVVCLFSDPTPLSEGKGAWQHFVACCKFFPMVRNLGHKGIVVQHYVFDRAIQSAMAKRTFQRHEMYYKAKAGVATEGELAFLQLQDWHVSTGCANHDCQNALQWGLRSSVANEEDVVKRMWVVIASLRNGYDLLYKHLSPFVSATLAFSEAPWDRQELYSFWLGMGVDSSICDILADTNLHWGDGRLWVGVRSEEPGALQEKVTTCLLAVFRFKQFTDSRWVTIGCSCRSLVASLLLGLGPLVDRVRKDPKSSDFYIQGFGQLNQEVRKYACVAAVAAHACDSVLLALLHDDRVAMHLDELEGKLQKELTWMGDWGVTAWQRLATVAGCPYKQLRSSTLQAAAICGAYMERKTFSEARKLPWSLVRGDLGSNLEALLAGPTPADPTSAKIQRLLQLGYNREVLKEGLERLADVHWSTTIIEQGHGSAAAVHKCHSQYGQDMLCTRAGLHMVRALLPCPDSTKQAARVSARLAALAKRQPSKATGRQVFLKHCMQAAAEGPIESRGARGRAIMRAHSSMWQALSSSEQAHFEQQALLLSEQKREELARTIIQAELETLSRNAMSGEDLDAGALRLSNCKFSGVELDSLATLYGSLAFSHSEVLKLRKAAMEPPVAPAPAVQAELDQVVAPVASQQPAAAWVASMARARRAFGSTAILLGEEGQGGIFAFLYATQSPLQATLLPLHRRPFSLLDFDSDPRPLQSYLEDTWDLDTDCQWGTCVMAEDLPHCQPSEVFVVPDLVFLGGTRWASHGAIIGLEEFLEEWPTKVAEPSTKKDTPKQVSELERLANQHPFLQPYLEPESPQPEETASSSYTPLPKKEELDDAAKAEVWAALNQKRLEFQPLSAVPVHFKTSVRGGVWTQEHLAVPFDSARGFASGKAVEAWCKAYGLKASYTVAFKKYSEDVAKGLALHWCRVMDHYYSLYLLAGGGDYVYTEQDRASMPRAAECFKALDDLPLAHPGFQAVQALGAIQPTSPK